MTAQPSGPPPPLAGATNEDILNLAEAGWAYEDIARMTGRPSPSIRTLARRAGLPPRRGNGRTGRQLLSDEDIERTVALYLSGMSYEEIRVELGIAVASVKHRLDLAGVPRRSRSEALRLAYSKGRWRPPAGEDPPALAKFRAR